MTAPTPGTPQPTGKSALSDLDNVGWVELPPEPVSEEDAYWRMRGMVPPPRTEPVE